MKEPDRSLLGLTGELARPGSPLTRPSGGKMAGRSHCGSRNRRRECGAHHTRQGKTCGAKVSRQWGVVDGAESLAQVTCLCTRTGTQQPDILGLSTDEPRVDSRSIITTTVASTRTPRRHQWFHDGIPPHSHLDAVEDVDVRQAPAAAQLQPHLVRSDTEPPRCPGASTSPMPERAMREREGDRAPLQDGTEGGRQRDRFRSRAPG